MSNYPGTVKKAFSSDGEVFLDGLFIGGNIMMSQINELTGIGTPTLQNWVNRGFLSRPIGKKYSANQLARILIINMLRRTVMLEDIIKLLYFVNGSISDDSDDIIDEAKLYGMVSRVVLNDNFSLKNMDKIIDDELLSYEEKITGAKARLKLALGVICRSYIAATLIEETEKTLSAVKNVNIFGKTI